MAHILSYLTKYLSLENKENSIYIINNFNTYEFLFEDKLIYVYKPLSNTHHNFIKNISKYPTSINILNKKYMSKGVKGLYFDLYKLISYEFKIISQKYLYFFVFTLKYEKVIKYISIKYYKFYKYHKYLHTKNIKYITPIIYNQKHILQYYSNFLHIFS